LPLIIMMGTQATTHCCLEPMGFRLSRSLSSFYDRTLAIRGPFSQTLPLLFYDGILAVEEPFSRTFSFFMMEFWLSRSLHTNFFFSRWNSRYKETFLTNLFLSFFTMELWLSRSLSHELFFFTMEFSKYAIWGKTLFIYISQRVFT
jgi:hypothetical protein